MFPAQTSLIPATIALVRYIEANGFGGLYPYWYLGTTPVKYLIGPVVPGILVGLHKILPQFSLFDLSLLSIVSCQLFASVGWGMLAWRLSGRRGIGVIGGIGVLLMPWHWVSGFALSELSAVAAGSLTPWVLLAYARVQNSKFKILSGLWLPSLVFALLLLTNSVSAIPAVVGMIIISIVNKQNIQRSLKKVLLVVFAGWLIATLWYGPGYWLTIWQAPSLGGKSAVLALGWVVDMLRGLVPLILAIWVILVGIRPKDAYSKFAYSWFGAFAVLTLIRFMADPDFWMDWTAWTGEVEVGLALLAASKFAKIRNISDLSPLRSLGNLGNFWSLVIGVLLIGGWFWAYKARDFWLPRKDIDNTVEFRIASWFSNNLTIQPFEFSQGKQSNNSALVFLSGTSAFWLNSLVDVAQVRGGVDQASVDPSTGSTGSPQAGSGWREAAWEIRQGATTEGTERVLRTLKINYLVVHTGESQEFYHDFSDPEIFEGTSYLKKVYDSGGDRIYKVTTDN